MLIHRGRYITMNEQYNFLRMLQITGGLFPVGSFHHSFGLETYIVEKTIKSIEDLKEFIIAYLHMSITQFEGKILCNAYELGLRRDREALALYDEVITAMRLTHENREANLKIGKAFVRMVMNWNKELKIYSDQIRKNDRLGNYSVVLGFAGGVWQMDKKELLSAFLFNLLNGMVQVGVKLIPLGQTESQIMMSGLFPLIEGIAAEILSNQEEEPANFTPALDIASMCHETLYCRLYMS